MMAQINTTMYFTDQVSRIIFEKSFQHLLFNILSSYSDQSKYIKSQLRKSENLIPQAFEVDEKEVGIFTSVLTVWDLVC